MSPTDSDAPSPFTRVLALVAERGLSEGRACERAGLDRSTLASARRSGGKLKLETIEAFARAFMVPVAQLLGEMAPAAAPTDPALSRLPLDAIQPSTLNPRRTFDEAALSELADSIAAQGLLQNLVVSRDDIYGCWRIVAGERRWRALRLLAEQGRLPIDVAGGVPVRVVEATEGERLAIALLENLQRQDVNPAEEAEGFARLQQIDPQRWTTRAIAEAVGGSQRAVQQRLALVSRLAPAALDALRAGEITFTQARTLTAAPAERQVELLEEIDPSLPAAELREMIVAEMIPAAHALFDLAPYADQLVEPEEGGDRLFVDADLFFRLQEEACKARRQDLLDAGAAWVEVVGYGQTLNHYRSWEYSTRPGNPAAGAVIHLACNGRVEIHPDLVRKTAEPAPAAAAAPGKGAAPAEPYTKAHLAHARRRKTRMLNHLADRYLTAAAPKGFSVDRWRGVTANPHRLDQVAAWTALMEMPDANVERLFCALVALRIGTFNGFSPREGDSPLALAIADSLGLVGAEFDAGLQLNPADLDGIRKDQLVKLMRQAGIEGDYPDKLADLRAYFLSMARPGYVLPTLRFHPERKD